MTYDRAGRERRWHADWRRTWGDAPRDYIASYGGIDVGRVYVHHQGSRWQWFYWHENEGSQGVADTRDEALAAIDALVLADPRFK